MEKRIVQYFISQPSPTAFPEDVIDLFAAEYQYGMINVEEGSAKEGDFLKVALLDGFISQLSKKKILICDEKGIKNHNFYFIYTREDKTYKMPKFWNYEDLCYSDSNVICMNNISQKKKIVLGPKRSNYDLDIMSSPYLPYPILISNKLKKILENENIIGYETVPCLEIGRDYSSDYLSFDEYDSHLSENANYYQMIVTSKVKHSPRVGNVHVSQRCPRCETVQGFFSEIELNSEGCFLDSDFDDSDIQYYDTFFSSNIGEFKVSSPITIISSRLLSVLVRKEIKGIKKYSSLFRLPYRFVDICK